MIPIYAPTFVGNEKAYVNDCLDTLWISSNGSYVKKFEKALAEYHNVEFAIVTSNCTTALHLSINGLNIQPGDEVICPALTFISPANMVQMSGAKLALVDVDEETLTLDIDDLKSKITDKTKAIIAVHQFGHASKMDEIMEIANSHGIAVIEDNAESIGGYFKNQILGSIGAISTFSFFGNKVITSGEGGALLTDDEQIGYRVRYLRDHGMNPKVRYEHIDLGYNYRMTNLQAAVGLAQLEKIDEINASRNDIRLKFEQSLSSINEVSLRKFADWCTPVHWLMTISVETRSIRERLIQHLFDDGIEARMMINPVHHAHHFRKFFNETDFPVSCGVSAKSLHLPSGNQIGEREINIISNSIKDFFSK